MEEVFHAIGCITWAILIMLIFEPSKKKNYSYGYLFGDSANRPCIMGYHCFTNNIKNRRLLWISVRI